MSEAEGQQRDSIELREYFRILWARKWTGLILFTLVVAGVMYYSYRQTPVYESEAQVLLPAPPAAVDDSGGVVFGKLSIEDEAAVASSEAVAARVAEALKRQGINATPSELAGSVVVGPKKGTSILLFRASNTDPKKAATIAQSFADQYLIYRREQQIKAVFDIPLASIKQQLSEVNRALVRTARVDPVRNPEVAAERVRLTTLRSDLLRQQREITALIEQLKTSDNVIKRAGVPSKPARPDHVRDGILAMIVGLVIGSAGAFVRDYMDDSLRGTEDIERQAGAPTIGAIPHFRVARGENQKGKKEREGSRPERDYLVALEDPKAPATEAYRTLRTNLMFMAATGPLRRVLLTSPMQAEGKSTTAANLAVVMAQAGQRVLLADADLRRPSVHRFFDLPNRVGLSSFLSAQASMEEVVQNPGIPGLRIVAGGPIPPNPVELLGSPVMRDFLDQIAEVTDWLIADTTPVLGLADASVLSSFSDGVLFVVSETTSRRALTQASAQLAKVRARIVGAIVNNFGPTPHYYSDYYQYAREYYTAGQTDKKEGRFARRERRKRQSEILREPAPDLEPDRIREPAEAPIEEVGRIEEPVARPARAPAPAPAPPPPPPAPSPAPSPAPAPPAPRRDIPVANPGPQEDESAEPAEAGSKPSKEADDFFFG